jgi:anti-sigma regulatory factor (Ser/Thr protein kinase)
MTTVELEIPPRSVYVGVVRLALASLARGSGLDEAAIDDLKIAVSEACATSVLALEEMGSDEAISITFTDGDGRVELAVADRGPGPPDTQSLEDSQGFDTRAAMSTALLGSLVDECTITAREGGGTLTRFVIAG